ncbi:hypothetical protein GCM10023085_45800 [Actinomadura viridis]|uniref:Uncharacterized protein n=1 Tax=Actinomadura viridis TaxID=58110 RepID=A0A931DMQ0_9ACTN|nr:hypothetical protein [Actinomadura viridis]MBG6089940.1 hypothetical protein [Actinomadura viridis]
MTGPRELRCAWIAPSEDPNTRLLVPGCMERVQDWEAPCTCKTTAEEVTELEERLTELKAEPDRQEDRYHALVAAVGQHHDAAALHQQAAENFRERRRMKAAVRHENASKENPS